MRPEIVALVRLVLFSAVGIGLGRLVCRGRAMLSVPEAALLSLSLAVLYRIAPWLAVGWAGLAVVAGRTDRDDAAPKLALPLLATIALLWCVRELEPTLWDEQIWLLKAKLATTQDLRTASLGRSSDAIPVGYPLGFPLACAWLGAQAVDLGALLVRALCIGAFATALLRHRPTSLARVAIVLCATPLVLVHARAAYVDLPMGLLSAALYLELSSTRPAALRAMVLATLLVTLKDEGIAHVLVLGVATVLARPKLVRRAVALALTSAGLAFASWRVLLYLHEVIPAEHALGRPAWSQLAPLAGQLAAHLTDVRSFGLLYSAALASVIVAVRVPSLRRDAAAWLLVLGALLWGVVAGPGRVREFAMSGTLLGRVLVQVAPLAAVLVGRAMEHFSAMQAEPEPLPVEVAAA